MSKLRRRAKWTALLLGGALVGIQLIPVDRFNPPVEEEVAAPPEVRAVLQRACYDCHSNRTDWPWYARVAPVSWQVAWDVHEGREAVNFSLWNRLPAKERAEAIHESGEEVAEGEMPPWLYVVAHPDARLSEADRTLLRGWARSAGPAEGDDD